MQMLVIFYKFLHFAKYIPGLKYFTRSVQGWHILFQIFIFFHALFLKCIFLFIFKNIYFYDISLILRVIEEVNILKLSENEFLEFVSKMKYEALTEQEKERFMKLFWKRNSPFGIFFWFCKTGLNIVYSDILLYFDNLKFSNCNYFLKNYDLAKKGLQNLEYPFSKKENLNLEFAKNQDLDKSRVRKMVRLYKFESKFKFIDIFLEKKHLPFLEEQKNLTRTDSLILLKNREFFEKNSHALEEFKSSNFSDCSTELTNNKKSENNTSSTIDILDLSKSETLENNNTISLERNRTLASINYHFERSKIENQIFDKLHAVYKIKKEQFEETPHLFLKQEINDLTERLEKCRNNIDSEVGMARNLLKKLEED